MAREPVPTWSFALVLVKKGHRFLLVHERKHGQGWYFPAGRVEPGESFAQAAVRETREEAGLDVVLEGVLRVEQVHGAEQRLRVFFLARARDDSAAKTVADEHSLGARWFSVEELASVTLRGDEVEDWMRGVLEGRIQPAQLSILEMRPL